MATNNAGVLVGQHITSAGIAHGMMLTGTTLTKIDDPHAMAGSTYCNAISNNNQVVGYYINKQTNLYEGFYYSGGTYTDIKGPAGAISSGAYGINDAGQIVGYYAGADNVTHSFLMSGVGGAYTEIGPPVSGQRLCMGHQQCGHHYRRLCGQSRATWRPLNMTVPLTLPSI